MKKWYTNNKEHPYPSHVVATVLAKSGDITVKQVKKWFSNQHTLCLKTYNIQVKNYNFQVKNYNFRDDEYVIYLNVMIIYEILSSTSKK